MERFKAVLLEISDQLGGDSLSKLKFLCQERIGRKKTEEIVSGTQLFEFLIQRAEIGPDDTALLRELLSNVGQQNLLHIIENYEQQTTPADPTDPSELVKINIATDVLVENLGRKWLQYGRKLGISDGKLDGIEEKHPRNLEEKVREVIREWKKMRKGQAVVDELIEALRGCNQNYTADIVVKKIQEI